MKAMFYSVILAAFLFSLSSCSDSTTPNTPNPNDFGGNPNVDFTDVGDKTSCYLYFNETYIENVKDSVIVTKNDNGIVTTFAKFTFDSTSAKSLDTLIGTHTLNRDQKFTILNTYLKKFGVSLDTADRKSMNLTVNVKSRITSEGIQDFMYSGGDMSKPFTLVKYSAIVGDKYEFTDNDNVKITRQVVYKSTTDDYDIVFWKIKVLKVEETKDDPIVEKIVYVANHKFGLVGVMVHFKNGAIAKLGLVPSNL